MSKSDASPEYTYIVSVTGDGIEVQRPVSEEMMVKIVMMLLPTEPDLFSDYYIPTTTNKDTP
jgi:hypothetical protein